jgi:hypothetical protein
VRVFVFPKSCIQIIYCQIWYTTTSDYHINIDSLIIGKTHLIKCIFLYRYGRIMMVTSVNTCNEKKNKQNNEKIF